MRLKMIRSVYETYKFLVVRSGISVSELTAIRGLSRKQVYVHLKILGELGVLEKERRGQRVLVRAKPGLEFRDFLRVLSGEYTPPTIVEDVKKTYIRAMRELGTSELVLVGPHIITYPFEPFVYTPTYEFLIPYEYYSVEAKKIEVILGNIKLVPAPRSLVENRVYVDGVPHPGDPFKAYIYARRVHPAPSHEIPVIVLYKWSRFKQLNNPIISALKAIVAVALKQDWKPFIDNVYAPDKPIILRYALVHRISEKYRKVIEALSRKNIVVFFDSRVLETYVNKICFGRECRVE